MRKDLQARYDAILESHLQGAGEAASLEAYDFARLCLREKVAPEDVIAFHLNRLESEPDVVKRFNAQELLVVVVMAFSLHYQQALRDLEHANQELEELSSFKTRMISMVAHDLTNHIVAMKLLTQAIARGCQDAEQQRRVESLRQIVDDEEQLIQNLLDIGRIESGRLELDVEPLDLMRLVERSAGKARSATTQHDITISGPPMLRVMADRSKTQQVLDNLFTNAVKYSPAGGRIDVTVTSSAGEALVSVRDHGIGIAAEDLPHVFEPFYRGGKVRRGDIKGSGLGLAIVKSLLRLQRGNIEAESVPGEGSTFRFTLPLA